MRNASRHFARIETQACRDLVAGPKLFADTPTEGILSLDRRGHFPDTGHRNRGTGSCRLGRSLCLGCGRRQTCFAATLRRVHMWPGLQSKRRPSISYRGSYLRLYPPSIGRFLAYRLESDSQEWTRPKYASKDWTPHLVRKSVTNHEFSATSNLNYLYYSLATYLHS
jgi:hypothetical protein